MQTLLLYIEQVFLISLAGANVHVQICRQYHVAKQVNRRGKMIVFVCFRTVVQLNAKQPQIVWFDMIDFDVTITEFPSIEYEILMHLKCSTVFAHPN